MKQTTVSDQFGSYSSQGENNGSLCITSNKNNVVPLMQKIYHVLIEMNKQTNTTSQSKDLNLSMLIASYSAQDLEQLVSSPQGSKLMQTILTKFCKKDFIQILMDNLILKNNVFNRLMTSKYSNYFIQTFIMHISSVHKKQIILKILSNDQSIFIKSAYSRIGTHCLQKFIDQITKENELITLFLIHFQTIDELTIMELIRNQNSCYLIQKVMNLIHPIDFRKSTDLQEQSVNILDKFLAVLTSTEDQFVAVCNDQHGVIIVKEIIKILNVSRFSGHKQQAVLQHDSKYARYLIIKAKYYQNIVDNLYIMAKNCYGNYII